MSILRAKHIENAEPYEKLNVKLDSKIEQHTRTIDELDSEISKINSAAECVANFSLENFRTLSPSLEKELNSEWENYVNQIKELNEGKYKILSETLMLLDEKIQIMKPFVPSINDNKKTAKKITSSAVKNKKVNNSAEDESAGKRKPNKRKLNSSSTNSTKNTKKSTKAKNVSKYVADEGDDSAISSDEKDEKTYCMCDQVFYGKMIMCDNKSCEIEWFHFACVGITQAPKGKWYCPKCSKSLKKKDSSTDSD